ncbi:MAG: thioredoxin domain-containing protein [Gemmatimonadaceae bacterium]
MSVADLGRYEGSDKAPIWIVMVSDFQCPYCKEWHDSTLTQVRREYVETGKARLAYLNLPIQGHQHAVVLAKASLCASAQKQFWPFANAVFSKQPTLHNLADAHALVNSISDSLKMDTPEFVRCQKSPAIDALLQSDLRQAGQARIQSTPSFFVGNFILQGAVPFTNFKTAVDSALVLAALKH